MIETEPKMKIILDRKDIISLAKGTSPNYDIMEDNIISKNGTFNGSQGYWEWEWNAFEDLTEDEIYKVYLKCKHSWENKRKENDCGKTTWRDCLRER